MPCLKKCWVAGFGVFVGDVFLATLPSTRGSVERMPIIRPVIATWAVGLGPYRSRNHVGLAD
jgi:hypothetical protein